jgi:ATP-dependent Clp protease ATP-binding subunit ClpA
MLQVVDKFMAELQQRLADKKVSAAFSSGARIWLARRGYDPAFGARPLGRLIQTEIGDVVASEILFGRLSKGGAVRIGLKDDRLTFSYREKSVRREA